MKQLTIIKVGGAIVEENSALNILLASFAAIDGAKILVHGGGRLATVMCNRLGIESRMIDGRRITDEETLNVVTMVYGGLVNKNIVARLQSLGVNAVGLTGADMNVIRSEKRPVKDIDYGYAGDVKEVCIDAFNMLLEGGFIPVLSPLTHDGKGLMLNTNADTIASETAKAMSKVYDVTLIYCFEKSGVLQDEHDDTSVISRLDSALYAEYVSKGIITGGMIPKLDNAFRAIASGVRRVIITKASALNAPEQGTVIE
ncbi:MAG: acetylglutamate kinase [Tannerella sp.]|jgi:acetylglutamate kinase|nr:acetylglutamate kinase [Tannerella sp.]